MTITEKLSVLEPPLLVFKQGQTNIDPISALGYNRYNPVSHPDFDGPAIIHIAVPKGVPVDNTKRMIDDLIAGYVESKISRCKFNPFHSIYGFPLKIGNILDYTDINDLDSIITKVSKSPERARSIIVIVAEERSELGGFYYQVKIASINKSVQTQIILTKTIENYARYNPEKKGDFLWNFSLGVFSKMGGVPWKLKDVLNGVCAFIGLNTIVAHDEGSEAYRREGVVALEVANRWGEPVNRFYSSNVPVDIDDDRYIPEPSSMERLIRNSLDEIESHLIKPKTSKCDDYVIIHTADRYTSQTYNLIQKVVESRGFLKVKIIQIDDDGALRLYDPKKSKTSYAWPLEGSYWWLEEGNVAYLYTVGRWKYYPFSEAYIIDTSNLSPLRIQLIRTSGTALTNDDLRHIYHLTRLHYYSSDLPRIKKPFTLRLGRKAAQLVGSGLSVSDFDVTYLY